MEISKKNNIRKLNFKNVWELTEPFPAFPQYIVFLPIERNKGFAARKASSDPPTWNNASFCS